MIIGGPQQKSFMISCQVHRFSKYVLTQQQLLVLWGIGTLRERGGGSTRRSGTEHQDRKSFRRELMRLETSLKSSGEKEKICFLHYPPRFGAYRCEEIQALLEQYESEISGYYGHLHGASQ